MVQRFLTRHTVHPGENLMGTVFMLLEMGMLIMDMVDIKLIMLQDMRMAIQVRTPNRMLDPKGT